MYASFKHFESEFARVRRVAEQSEPSWPILTDMHFFWMGMGQFATTPGKRKLYDAYGEQLANYGKLVDPEGCAP